MNIFGSNSKSNLRRVKDFNDEKRLSLIMFFTSEMDLI